MRNRDYAFDYYAREAQRLGYRSRAALKLKEIHEKFKIFKPGMNVLDLGAAPGGWCQAVQKWMKEGNKKLEQGGEKIAQSRIVGIDILPMQSLHGIELIQCDIAEYKTEEKFDVILSDMCPNKTGNALVDQARMYDLITMALETAKTALITDGQFVCKFFDGQYKLDLTNLLQSVFKKCFVFKPKSSRDVSSEFYFYCSGLKV